MQSPKGCQQQFSSRRWCHCGLPEFTLLPYAGFIDKLRFSADEEDYSQPRYISWCTRSLLDEETISSAASVHYAPILKDEDIRESDVLVLFGGQYSKHAGAERSFEARNDGLPSHINNAVFAVAKATGKN